MRKIRWCLRILPPVMLLVLCVACSDPTSVQRDNKIDILATLPSGTNPALDDVSDHIQAAFDSGRNVYFPPGQYRVDSTLELKTDDQIISGSGTLHTSARICLRFSESVRGVRIEGLRIENSADHGDDYAVGIYVPPGLSLESSVLSRIELVGFYISMSLAGAAALGNAPYDTDSPAEITVTECIIRDTKARERAAYSGIGLYARGGGYDIRNNVFRNLMGSGLLGPGSGLVANNTVVDVSSNGIYVSGGEGVLVSNNVIAQCGVDGIAIAGSRFIEVTRNMITGAANGLFRIQGSVDIVIDDNFAKGSASTSHVIRGFANQDLPGSQRIDIINNRFEGPTTATPIVFSPANSPYELIVVRGNTLDGFDTAVLAGGTFGVAAIWLPNGSPGCAVRENIFIGLSCVTGYPESLVSGATQVEGNVFGPCY